MLIAVEKLQKPKSKQLYTSSIFLIVFNQKECQTSVHQGCMQTVHSSRSFGRAMHTRKMSTEVRGIYLFLLISKDDFDTPIVIIRSLARMLDFASLWADSHLEWLRKSITQSPLHSVRLMVKSGRSYQAYRVLIHTRWNLEAKYTVLELLITL